MGLDMGPARQVLNNLEGDTIANNQILDAGYEMRELAYLFFFSNDLFMNKKANKTMCEHLCEKIRVLIKDL
jgi:hypothetical protein